MAMVLIELSQQGTLNRDHTWSVTFTFPPLRVSIIIQPKLTDQTLFT